MDLETFIRRGDGGAADPVNALSTDSEPATFFGPDGSTTKGPDRIKSAYSKSAASFGPTEQAAWNSSTRVRWCVGYWCGIQHAEVEVDGKNSPVTFRLTDFSAVGTENGN